MSAAGPKMDQMLSYAQLFIKLRLAKIVRLVQARRFR